MTGINLNCNRMKAIPKYLVARSRILRQFQTEAEKYLWYRLRNGAFCGVRFKRQVVFGPYIVDFYCASAQLVIELDGGQHNTVENRRDDAKRTAHLEGLGLKVVRFWNPQVFLQTESVLEAIWKVVNQRPPSPYLFSPAVRGLVKIAKGFGCRIDIF